jgi:ribokinase
MPSENHPSNARIVVVGSSNTDMIVQIGRIPGIGETVIGGKLHTAGGGKGANQAVAASRAGARVVFVGRVGSDGFGKTMVAGLRRYGINVSYVTRDKRAPTGVAFIIVGSGGENSIAVASGANLRLCSGDVAKAKEVFRQGGILLVQLETPLPPVRAAVTLAAKLGMRVILNPAPAQPLPDTLLRKVDILTPNEYEAELLTGIRVDGEAAAARAADRLRRRGVKTVIVTLGSCGAFVAGDGCRTLAPAFKVRAVDTTAAGDVFNGALAVALAEGRPLLEAVRFGQAAAAISVTRIGAQTSAPSRAEIERFLRKHLLMAPSKNALAP